MNKFAVAQPKDYAQAASLLADRKYSLPVLKAGGMDVLDHLKEGLTEPDLLINVKRLRTKDRNDAISREGDLIRIEAWATLSQIVESSIIRESAPVVAQAVEFAATPQVRNVATAAGNLLQRPRCWYYRNDQFNCLKKGGSTCFAVDGENRYHAILGGGPCHIVHPSNLAPSLNICDAVVHLIGSKRASVPLNDLYHLPDKGVKSEHNLEPGEIITHVTLKAHPRSGFHAVKEKQSFDWPLALACVSLQVNGQKIEAARVCAGAVAPVPWRLPKVEEALSGVSITDDAALRKASAIAAAGAKPMTDNAYKVQLLSVVVHRAILKAAGLPSEGIA
ncbi:MAG: FAD binding domain-containing protein [Pyrinomonadaceae bacterium]|nr:FAD binding domain-containing protein [Phycisphaerales bacterium]